MKKDWVRPYYKSQAFDPSCRPHGGCPWCVGNRMHQRRKQEVAAEDSEGEHMTTRHEISEWFDRGKLDGATHMIVVCDTFDHEDYPCYAKDDAEAWEVYNNHDGLNMQRIMEVYDLRQPKQEQLNEARSFHLPARPVKRIK